MKTFTSHVVCINCGAGNFFAGVVDFHDTTLESHAVCQFYTEKDVGECDIEWEILKETGEVRKILPHLFRSIIEVLFKLGPVCRYSQHILFNHLVTFHYRVLQIFNPFALTLRPYTIRPFIGD